MTKRCFFCLILMLPCAVNGLAQTGNKRPPRRRPAVARQWSAVGILYGVGAGQRITSCFLKTPDGVIEFSTTDRTRTSGFNDGERAWSLGAQWQVIYHESTDRALGAVADSVSFTGRVEQSIADAVRLASEYQDLLSNGNYGQAYAKLSPSARQGISFDDFKRMYKSVEVNMSSEIICSHSGEKVVLLLAPQGSEGGLYQRCEMVWTADGWRIDRLLRLESSEGQIPRCWEQ